MMCGFTGYLCAAVPINAVELLQCMSDAIVHRGPDDGGIWLDNEAGVGLAHRRLSIVDLSPAGGYPLKAGQFQGFSL